MLEQSIETPTPDNKSLYVEVGMNGKLYSGGQGLFLPAVNPGQPVKSADVAGMLYSVMEPERAPVKVCFIEDGIVLTVINRGMVSRGELLVMTGNITNRY